jgi:hypothetical protein
VINVLGKLGIFLQIKEDKFGKEILEGIGDGRILINQYSDLLNGLD